MNWRHVDVYVGMSVCALFQSCGFKCLYIVLCVSHIKMNVVYFVILK